METKPSRDVPAERVVFLDALRGFDMFWIVGGSDLLVAATKQSRNPVVQGVVASLTSHVDWDGFHFHDGIFPLFLFLIGATLPWSIGRRLEAGEAKRAIVGKIVRRFAILTLLGLVVNGVLDFPGWDSTRFFGVLQRQAFGYLGAALLFVFSSVRVQALAAVLSLIAYGLLLQFLPVPGAIPGSWSPETNVAYAVDRWLLLPGQRIEEFGDPEGPLSHIPGVTTALAGLLAGTWVRRATRSGHRKSALLCISGAVAFGLGWALHPVMPIVKKIWTPSFVLVACGMSAFLMGVAHQFCDVWKKAPGARFWSVIGANAIVAYMAVHLIEFGETSRRLLGGVARQIPVAEETILATGTFLLVWGLLWVLQRHRIHIRV